MLALSLFVVALDFVFLVFLFSSAALGAREELPGEDRQRRGHAGLGEGGRGDGGEGLLGRGSGGGGQRGDGSGGGSGRLGRRGGRESLLRMRELTPARRLRRFLRGTPTAIGGRKKKRSRGSPSRGSGGGRGGEHSGKEVLLVSFFSDQGFERRRKRKSINKSLRSHGEGAPVLDSLSFSRPCPLSHGQPPRRRSPSSRRAWSERLWLLRAGPVSLSKKQRRKKEALRST